MIATVRELVSDPAFIVLCLVTAACLIWITQPKERG